METTTVTAPAAGEQKFIKRSEFILYLVAVFFYTNMTGMTKEDIHEQVLLQRAAREQQNAAE